MILALLLMIATMVAVTLVASAVLVVAAAPHSGGRFDRLPGVQGAAAWLHR